MVSAIRPSAAGCPAQTAFFFHKARVQVWNNLSDHLPACNAERLRMMYGINLLDGQLPFTPHNSLLPNVLSEDTYLRTLPPHTSLISSLY